jgi:hypothetical protein
MEYFLLSLLLVWTWELATKGTEPIPSDDPLVYISPKAWVIEWNEVSTYLLCINMPNLDPLFFFFGCVLRKMGTQNNENLTAFFSDSLNMPFFSLQIDKNKLQNMNTYDQNFH